MLNNSPMNYAFNGQGYYPIPPYRVSGGAAGGMPPAMPQPVAMPSAVSQPGLTKSGMMPGTVPGTNPGVMQSSSVQPGMLQPVVPAIPAGSTIPGVSPTAELPTPPGLAPLQQSFIENILRFNLGKIGTFYMTYENNTQWNAKVFKGKVEAAGRDHIIISDPKTGVRTLLLMVNLDYATFDEPLKYTSPYQIGNP